MSKRKNAIWFVLLIVLAGNLSLTSCKPQQQVQYFMNTPDTLLPTKIVYKEPLIQKGDLLSISIFSDDPRASAPYNQPVAAPTAVAQTVAVSSGQGYLVDQSGEIRFYGIGVIKVEGMTKKQLSTLICDKLNDQAVLKNPYAEVRFLNYKVTINGEVARPGSYSIPAEKINLLEALGLAGELTPYGRRDNILLIREEDGQRQFVRVDLTKADVFQSPYYYLQQNDIIIVEATKVKAQATDQVTERRILVVTSIVSTIAILISVLKN